MQGVHLTMKKNILFGIIIFIITGMGSYYYFDQKTNVVIWSADFEMYESVHELVDDSDLIVIGNPKAKKNHIVIIDDGIVEEGYTITDFKINKVVSADDIDEKAHLNDIIVVEPYYYYDDPIGQSLISIEGYAPMRMKGKYILFLQSNREGDMYLINGVYQGKHNINAQNSERDIFKDHANSIHLREDVLSKYENEITAISNQH